MKSKGKSLVTKQTRKNEYKSDISKDNSLLSASENLKDINKKETKHLEIKPFYKSWQFYMPLLGLLLTITAISLSYMYFSKNSEKEMSNISCQMIIQPRSPNLETKGYLYYQSWYLFINNGPATSKTLLFRWFINNKYVDLNSKAYLSGPTHGTDVEIVETTTPGYFEIIVKNMPNGAGFTICIDHRVKEIYGMEILNAWNKNLFSSDFTSYFLYDINATGEKMNFTYDGIYELEDKKK